MEPQDADVGYWIKDALYTFVPGKRKEDAKRLYFIETEEQKKLQRCKEWASNYFLSYDQNAFNAVATSIQVGSDVIVYRNGRVFYLYDVYPNQVPFEIQNPIPLEDRSELCGQLTEFSGVDYDMSGLICTQLANDQMDWSEILELMKGCSPTKGCDPCTKVGYKISRSLIKIAALRIFADPEQSIMEFPVNSLDAYNPSRKIGKFGMGFFSGLYWLVGHPARKMIINSYSRDREGKWCTYSITIREIEGILSFNLTIYPGSEITTAGFRVFIDASADPFSEENVENFRNQLQKLRFSFGADIIYGIDTSPRMSKESKPEWWSIFENTGGTLPTLNSDKDVTFEEAKNIIICYVCPSFILVEDYASGVPLEVALGSLFVPSISTKTIQLSETSTVSYVNQSRYIRSDPTTSSDRLVILVGGIAVVSIEQAPKELSRGLGDYYVIHMPYNTRLPVSRDDVILTSETLPIFKESIRKIFEELTNASDADVSVFQTLLAKYRDFTPNTENQTTINQALVEAFDTYRSRLVPEEHKQLYRKLSPRFISSVTYDTLQVERWLDENTKPLTNIWYGVKVLIVPGLGTNITNGGLINYLFISEVYQKSLGGTWVPTITTSYFATKLYPYDSSYGTKEYARYDKINLYTGVFEPLHPSWPGSKLDRNILSSQNAFDLIMSKATRITASQVIEEPEILRYLFAVLAKFESLTIYFDFSPNTTEELLISLVACYIFLTRASFITILGELMKRFSSFIGNQTYASSKNKLEVARNTNWWATDRLSLFLMTYFADDAISGPKKEPFLVEHIVASIRAIKEVPNTRLVIVTANNPYSLILIQKTYNDFWKYAWEQSSNFIEFTILMAGAGRAFAYKRINTPVLPGFIAYLLQEIRARRYDMVNLVDMYETWENENFTIARLTKVYLKKAREVAEEWVKNIQNTSTISTITVYVPPKDMTTVRLGNMIRALFRRDIPSAGNLLTFLKDVSQEESSTPLQIIEIAVNEGTVKPFIEATMTELVQNSIDAIREFNPTNKVIDIHLQKTTEDPTSLILSISDSVGMTSDAFIYVGIPFLSTKTPSELVTGEMGSGFFNSYRESSSVLVESSRDGVMRRSYDVPIRDARGRVVDIEKSIAITKGWENKTTITITIPTSSRLDEVTKIARVDYMAKNVLGLALVPDIRYNLENISIPKVLAAKVGYFELYFTDPDKSIKHESYLLTKGVPFAPLAPYFKTMLHNRALDVIERNFIVNITHGGYTPVQTRTRINIPPEVAADFKKVAIYTVFITMVREVYQEHRKYALSHMDSTGDANQLYFGSYDIENFYGTADEASFLTYTTFFGQPTLAELINNAIKVMGSEPYKDRKAAIDAVLDKYNSPYPEINKMVKAIAVRWLEKKNKHKPPTEEKGKVKHKVKGRYVWVDPDEVPDEPDPEIEPFVRAWVNTFWKLAREAKISGYAGRGSKAAPTVSAVYSIKNQSKTGWYSSSDNTITINTYNWNDGDRKQILKVLKEKSVDALETKLKSNKTWDQYFGYRFPSSTLPHEMEHYRRKQTHELGGHDNTYIWLFPGDEVKTRTFDQAANAIFQQILAKGFYEEFFKVLK